MIDEPESALCPQYNKFYPENGVFVW